MLSLLNRATTYSVPLFLLVSCVLAARSLEKNRDPIRFYRSRLPGVIYPYLVWTAIFWILTLASSPATRHLHAGVPEFFTHPMARLNDLVWGKAAFHLYFMVVLSQTILFLPCLFWKPLRELISRLSSGNNNSGWGLFIALWLLIQVMVQALQHFVLKLPYPGSTFLWYSSAWWLALLIAAQWPRLGGLSIPKSTYLTVGLGVGAIYFGGAFQSLLGKSPFYLLGTRDWFSENFVLAVYCGFIATLVLRVARLSIQPAQLAHIPWLEWLGKNSLQIYLVHVLFLELLAKGFIVSLLARTHLGQRWSWR
jgi:surface polysaccharide O-acyltransferase-like enzyme